MSTILQDAAAGSLPIESGGVSAGGPVLLVGPGGYATIQAALNAARPGETVFVQPGTYAENLVVTTNYVTLVGAQAGGYGRPDIGSTGVALIVRAQGFVAKKCRFTNSTNLDTVQVEGNGFRFEDCVFDGNSLQATTKAVVRIWTHATDSHFTGSEGILKDCLIRGGGAKGLAFDCQAALVGVLPTDDVLSNVIFADNVAEDIFLGATAVSVADMKRCVIYGCHIGVGGKNKATHIDIQTNKIGTANTSVFEMCFINDDTIDTTAIKMVGAGASCIGCYNLDGVINGDLLD